jgi:hypothetical protein
MIFMSQDKPLSPFQTPSFVNAGADLMTWMLARRRRNRSNSLSPHIPRPPGIPAHAGAWLRGNMPVRAVPGSPDSDPSNELDAPAPVPNPPAYPGMTPPSPQVPAFRGLLNLGAPQANPGFRGLLNLPLAAPDPGLGSFAADEGDLSPQFGLIAQFAALLGHNSAPNPYSPPPPSRLPEVLPHAQPSPLLTNFQQAADEASGQTDTAPTPAPPDLPEFRGLLSQFGRGLLNVGIGGLNPSPLSPDFQQAADEAGGQTGDAAPTIPSYSPAPPVYDNYAGVPQWKRQFFRDKKQAQPWIDFNQATGYLPGVSANEKSIYREIFAAEGGMVPDGRTVSGITPRILHDLHRLGKLGDWAADAAPADLTPDQTTQVYRSYMDNALQGAGGHEVLQNIDHPGVAAFVGDTLFRAGGPSGTAMVQQAINAVRDAHGQDRIGVDQTFGTLNDAIRTPEDREILAGTLSNLRDLRFGETDRDQHFYELATQ